MIYVKVKKSIKGHRLSIRNKNGNIFNDFYTRNQSAKKAWKSFVKQVKEGKWDWE